MDVSGSGARGPNQRNEPQAWDATWLLPPASAPLSGSGRGICPHCWEINPGAFRLCARCGADMRTILQESGGMRRTAPIQSPVPVGVSERLSLAHRVVLGGFVVLLALSYLVYLLPQTSPESKASPVPAGQLD